YPLSFYLGGLGAVTLGVTWPLLWLLGETAGPPWALALAEGLVLLGASQLALSFVNWLASVFLPPLLLPRLDFSQCVPAEHRTLVVVPTMLTSSRGIEGLLEALEVRYLANRDANVLFALLTDFCDAPQEHLPGDDGLLQQTQEGIAALNEKYREDNSSPF